MIRDGGGVAGVISINAIGDEIPIAGEVMIAGTAVYFAPEWVRGHWQDTNTWTDDAGHFVGGVATGALHDGEKLLSWLNPV